MINLIESLVIASQMATAVLPKYDSGLSVSAPPALVDRIPSSFDAAQNDFLFFRSNNSPPGCYSLGLKDKEAVKTRTEQIFERLAGEEVSRLYPVSVSENTGVNTRFYLSTVTENFVIDSKNVEISMNTFKKDMLNENRQARNPQSILLVGHVDGNEMRSALGNLPLDHNYDAVSLAPRLLQTQFRQKIPAAIVVDKTGSIVAVCGSQETASAINAGTFISNFKEHPTFQGKAVLETDFVLENKTKQHIIPVQRGDIIYGIQKKADGSGNIIAFLSVEDLSHPAWKEWQFIGSQPAKAIADSKEEDQPTEKSVTPISYSNDSSPVVDGSVLALGGLAGILGFMMLRRRLSKKRPRKGIVLAEGDFEENCARQRAFRSFVDSVFASIDHSHRGPTTAELARDIETGVHRHWWQL